MCMAEQCKHLLCFDEIFGVEISDVSSWQCFVYLNNFCDGNIWKFGKMMIYAQITISTALKIIKLSLWMNMIVFKEEGNRK